MYIYTTTGVKLWLRNFDLIAFGYTAFCSANMITRNINMLVIHHRPHSSPVITKSIVKGHIIAVRLGSAYVLQHTTR
jgi:hypothetical protein